MTTTPPPSDAAPDVAAVAAEARALLDGYDLDDVGTDLARHVVALAARVTAAEAARAALAGAVREERAAREAVPEGFDADHAGADERARVYALWDAVEAAQKHLDALLSGTDADAAGGE